MKNFCVSYDLIGDDRDYDHIEDELFKLKGEKIQKSVWILQLSDSWFCADLEKELRKYFLKRDRLFISRIPDNYVSINPI